MAIRHAVIMAAGRGTRMTPITELVPKGMAPYRGSTLVARGIDRLRPHIDNIHVTVGYKKAMLAQHVVEHGARSVFNTEGHGNAWWLFNTMLSHLDEPLYVLTCDNVVELDFELLERDYRQAGEPPCMLVPALPVSGLAGDYIFHRDRVVTEITRERRAGIYCSGIQIVHPARINALIQPVEDFASVWGQLIALRELRVASVYPSQWFAVDTIAQLELLNAA